MTTPTTQHILDFWFGPLNEHGLSNSERSSRWYRKSPAFDAEIKQNFEAVYRQLAAGELEDWRRHPEGWLASIVVLDQFSRNMFRDTPQMYAADGMAQQITRSGMDGGFDQSLEGHQRAFAYMPLMHSETLADQERCVTLFEQAVKDAAPAARGVFETNLKYAISHRDIVRDWGRFPHRNAILGRESTPEEIAFLKTPGSGF